MVQSSKYFCIHHSFSALSCLEVDENPRVNSSTFLLPWLDHDAWGGMRIHNLLEKMR